MDLLRQGETEALGELYQRYGAFVDRAIVSAAPGLGPQEVEDLCHDVFMVIAASATKYRESGKLKAWLYSIAARVARQRRRQKAIRHRLHGLLHGWGRAWSSVEAASPEVGAMVETDLVLVLKSLSEKERQVLVLFEHEGMTGEEIAEVLRMNLNTVWTNLRRARAAVLSALSHSAPLSPARRMP